MWGGQGTFPLTKLNLSPYFCSAFLQKGPCELFIPPPCRLFLPSTDKLIKCFSACSIGVAKTHTVSLNTLELYPSLRSRTWCWLERKIIPNSYFDSVVCDWYSHDHVLGKPLEWKTMLMQSWEISVISTVCKDNHFKRLKLRWEQTCRRTLEKSAGGTCVWAVIRARLMLCTVPSKRRG